LGQSGTPGAAGSLLSLTISFAVHFEETIVSHTAALAIIRRLAVGTSICVALSAALAPAASAQAVGASVAACDRACIDTFLDQYLTAIVGRDPTKAPLAITFRQTENAVVVPDGEGLWGRVAALGPVQRRFLDPVTGTAAYFGLLTLERGEPAIASLRLHIAGDRIDEAEWHVSRRSDTGIGPDDRVFFDPDYLVANPPPARIVAPESRLTREQLIAIADTYFDGLVSANARVVRSYADCDRIENGLRVTGNPLPPDPSTGRTPGLSNCTSGLDRIGVALIAGRRYPLVDEEAQVVLAIATLIRTPNDPRRRNHFMEFFYTDNARIRTIYAVLFLPPPNKVVPNWPPFDGNFPLPASFGPVR
jgi:hypothetical protein